MTPELWDRLGPFRNEAVARGVPADEVERWAALARPCATLTQQGEGPVVGRFGGPLLLPPDVPDPAHPFVASVDLASLPAGVTDLPLPADGHLLLFAFLEEVDVEAEAGSALHVPVGAPVVERDRNTWNGSDVEDYERMFAKYQEGPLHLTTGVSLPHHHLVSLSAAPWVETLPGHPRAEELVSTWEKTGGDAPSWGSLQLGGYSAQVAVATDPVAAVVEAALYEVEAGRVREPVSSDVADWVLLADWHTDVTGWEGASVHWAVQREDLAAGRFDRVFATMYWNP